MEQPKPKKHTKKQLDAIYKRLYRTILKYGSAKVVITRRNGEIYGQRYIRKDGLCKISYWHGTHSPNYGRKYILSCFYENYTDDHCKCCKKKRANLSRTLKEMREHDNSFSSLLISEVKYGPRFNKKMKL